MCLADSVARREKGRSHLRCGHWCPNGPTLAHYFSPNTCALYYYLSQHLHTISLTTLSRYIPTLAHYFLPQHLHTIFSPNTCTLFSLPTLAHYFFSQHLHTIFSPNTCTLFFLPTLAHYFLSQHLRTIFSPNTCTLLSLPTLAIFSPNTCYFLSHYFPSQHYFLSEQ